MAKNIIFDKADKLEIPVIAGVVSGDPVVLGDFLPGIALTDRDADGNAACKFSGVVEVSVTFAGAKAIGVPIYITQADYALTDTAGAGKVTYGILLTTVAGAGAATVRVRLGTPGQGA